MQKYLVLALCLICAGTASAASTVGVTVKITGVTAGHKVNVGISYTDGKGPVFQQFHRLDGSGAVSFSVPSNAGRVNVEANAVKGKFTCRDSKMFSYTPHEVTLDLAKHCSV